MSAEMNRRTALGALFLGAPYAVAAAGFGEEKLRHPDQYAASNITRKDVAHILKRISDSKITQSITGPNSPVEGVEGDTWRPDVDATAVALAMLLFAKNQFNDNGVETVISTVNDRKINFMWDDDIPNPPSTEVPNPINIKIDKGLRMTNKKLYGDLAKDRPPQYADDFLFLVDLNEMVKGIVNDTRDHVDDHSLAALSADIVGVGASGYAGAKLLTEKLKEDTPKRKFLKKGVIVTATAIAAVAATRFNMGRKLVEAYKSTGDSGYSLGSGYNNPSNEAESLLSSSFFKKYIQGKLIVPTPVTS